MDFDYIKIITTVLLSVLGWIVAHYFTDKRSRSSKRREIVLEYLINAFRVLSNEVSHREPNKERDKKIEDIMTDIQLFGSLEQVALAKEIINTMVKEGCCELDSLLNDLRVSLREELGLKKVVGNVSHLRFNSKKSRDNID